MKASKEIKIQQTIATTNDTNGNPRRLELCYSKHGTTMLVIEHGYRGKPELENRATVIDLGRIEVTGKAYRQIKADAKRLNIYQP